MTPLEVIQATSPKINKIGAVYYFDPDTLVKGKELGLDGFRMYVLGRGGVLGDVAAPVIVGAFGYFSDGIVAKMWDSARERASLPIVVNAYDECNHEIGRTRLGAVEGLEAFNAAAEKVFANTHPAGLTLYSGYSARPVPDDAAARAMHNSVVMRELRGSVHLVAIVANGLTPRMAHAIKRPDDQEMFGYEGLPSINEADRVRLAAAEKLTDELMIPAFSWLSDEEGDALVAGTNAMFTALTGEDA